MILITKIFYGCYLFVSQIIALKLFYSILFVLHPQNSFAIEIKRYINLWYFKLSMSFYLAMANVDLV